MIVPDLIPSLRSYLASIIGVPVVVTRPDDGTTKFVLLIATGGTGRERRVLQRFQVTVDSYGPTPGVARALAYSVDAAMYSLAEPSSGIQVSRVTGSSPADSPDVEPESPRFTATYQLLAKLAD